MVCFFVIQPLSDTYIQSNTTQQALVLKQQVYGCEQANTATTLHISLCLSLGKIFCCYSPLQLATEAQLQGVYVEQSKTVLNYSFSFG